MPCGSKLPWYVVGGIERGWEVVVNVHKNWEHYARCGFMSIIGSSRQQ